MAIGVAIKVGILKGLAKLIVHRIGGGAVLEQVATEITGEATKPRVDQAVTRLVAQYVEGIEKHPEFASLPSNEAEATSRELDLSLQIILRDGFAAQHGYEPKRIVDAVNLERKHGGVPQDLSDLAVSLYRLALNGLVRAVLALLENVKGWKITEAALVQSRFDELVESIHAEASAHAKISQVLGVMQETLEVLLSQQFAEKRSFLEAYLRAIRATQDVMDLSGLELDPKNRARTQRLSVAYISLSLIAEGTRSVASWPNVLSKLEALPTPYLFVRGDAGMGKTTLLRWAAIAASAPRNHGELDAFWKRVLSVYVDREAAVRLSSLTKDLRDFEEEIGIEGPVVSAGRESWRNRIPLLIVLRDCKDSRLPSPNKYPSQLCAAVGDPPPRFIESLLEGGKALVMIDGLDEVPPGNPRTRLDKDIQDLIALYGERGNLFVFTSRPLTQPFVFQDQCHPMTVDIAAMSELDRDLLIRKWHDAAAAQLVSEAERLAVVKKADDLIDALSTRPSVSRVASTPLLCAMLCAQCGILNYTLPAGEWQIIEGLCQALLWRRDKERALPSTETTWDGLEYPQRKELVARLANYMIKERLNSVDDLSANSKLEHFLAWIGIEKGVVQVVAPEVRQRLTERGGILRVARSGALEFVHDTFKEFLAAIVFVNDMEFAFLAEHAPIADCANVCRFTSGVGNPTYSKQLIEAILGASGSEALRRLVAVRMTAAAPTLDPEVRARVKLMEGEMFPPKSAAEAQTLAELGDEVIERLRFDERLKSDERVFCVATLVQIGTEMARQALVQYASIAEAENLIDALAQGVNPLDIPFVRRSLVATSGDASARGRVSQATRRQVADGSLIEWLARQSRATRIEQVDLAETAVTDAGLQKLLARRECSREIRSISLDATSVTDISVKAIANPTGGLRNLSALHIADTAIGDDGIAAAVRPMSRLKNLRLLSMANTRVSVRGLRHMLRRGTPLADVEALFIGGRAVSNEWLQALGGESSGLRGLKVLSIRDATVTDVGFELAANNKSALRLVSALDVLACGVSDEVVPILLGDESGFASLRDLGLFFTKVTDRALEQLASGVGRSGLLHSLELAGDFSDVGLLPVVAEDSKLAGLRRLHIVMSRMTDATCDALRSPRSGVRGLSDLRLGHLGVSEEAIGRLLLEKEGLRELKTLDVSAAPMSSRALGEFAEDIGCLPNLDLLILPSSIPDADITTVQKKRSGLRVRRGDG